MAGNFLNMMKGIKPQIQEVLQGEDINKQTKTKQKPIPKYAIAKLLRTRFKGKSLKADRFRDILPSKKDNYANSKFQQLTDNIQHQDIGNIKYQEWSKSFKMMKEMLFLMKLSFNKDSEKDIQ